ncbi:hypothetical protein PVK06_038996 [Gossypium arboreum]|uniref:RNase H type-1 domain-containing protein n=1 Tax=Gossypium arboreum TaxID=29729 RepID=A0ABR0N278_GOSAR|nr:hypothetical protein PVK06_038996 [Gossypium arboreum]
MGFNQLDDKEKKVLVIAYWAIWHAWNRFVHDGITPNIPELVVFIKARNENGEILVACTYPHFGVTDAFIAEAQVCKQIMTFAQKLRFRSIPVEGNSLIVMKKLNNTDSDRSVLGLIIQDIKRKVRGFNSVTFRFVARSANTTTHVLARSGCRLLAPQYWIKEALLEVECATTLD